MSNIIDLAEIRRCKTYDELNQFLDELEEVMAEIQAELEDLIGDE